MDGDRYATRSNPQAVGDSAPRHQVSCLRPDGHRRTDSETDERKGDAERVLTLIEAKMISGEWVDPDRGCNAQPYQAI